MRILAATDFSTRSNRAVRQAGLLARGCDAPLDIVHVVDDDLPPQMLDMERREAERILAEQIGGMAELNGIQCHPMVVIGDPFDGILKTAAANAADLIVMGQHRRVLLRDIFVGTTIERVVRARSCPVLMVNNEAQQRYERILIAVDMSEPSADAVRLAQNTPLLGDSRPTLLHVFQPLAKGKVMVSGVAPAELDQYVASERERTRAELNAFLAARGLGGTQWQVRVQEGDVSEVLARTVRDMRCDLLVMGTSGRSGILKALLGSTTEQALRTLDVDILAVPPAG